jgi:hypothetical protein
MIGTPFQDHPDAEPRGLAPSDFAVLLRSVRNNGDPIVDALQRVGLPVVVVGMTTLFEQPEIEAARCLFRFMGLRDVTREQLRRAWLNADLGIEPAALDAAITIVELQREWDDEARWSVYNLQRTFLAFLEEIGLREENVPGGRGEIVFYNLGKFSQVISDYEQIHFQSDPARKYEGFALFLIHQAPGSPAFCIQLRPRATLRLRRLISGSSSARAGHAPAQRDPRDDAPLPARRRQAGPPASPHPASPRLDETLASCQSQECSRCRIPRRSGGSTSSRSTAG